MILTSSEMKQWQTCRRGWWLSYYRGLRKRFDLPSLPNIGNLVHYGLERYYDALRTGENPPWPPKLVADRGERLILDTPELTEQILDDVEMAAIMLDGYMEWAVEEGIDFGLEVVAAEQMVEAPVGPFTLRGKIDARLRRQSDGALLQLEHKTVGSLTDHPKWAQSNPQFLTYDLLAFLTKPDGVPTDGVIVNQLRRVKRTARAKPPFYGRHEVRHNVDELRNHWKHVLSIGTQIAAARDELDSGEDHHLVCPPNITRDHSWQCVCSEVTSMFDDGSDAEGFLAEFWEPYDPLERYGREAA